MRPSLLLNRRRRDRSYHHDRKGPKTSRRNCTAAAFSINSPSVRLAVIEPPLLTSGLLAVVFEDAAGSGHMRL